MKRKIIWMLLLLIGAASSLTISCKRNCDDGDPGTIIYAYTNKTDHLVEILKYRGGEYINTSDIAARESLSYRVIQGSGDNLLLYDELHIVFDHTKKIVCTRDNNLDNQYNLFIMNNYHNEHIKKGITKYTYIITEDFYDLATEIVE